MVSAQNNYVIGAGELHFASFRPDTEEPDGYRWIGNVPAVSLNNELTTVPHFASYLASREKDASAETQVNRTGGFTTDNISPENMAIYFLGDSRLVTAVGASVVAEPLNGVKKGYSYQLGESAANPTGAKAIVYPGVAGPPSTIFAVKKGVTSYVRGTDYLLDPETGMVEILTDGSIVEGDDLTVDYTFESSTRSRVVSGGTSIVGALKWISRNTEGRNNEILWPKVKITSNGDFNLVTDTWQEMQFTLDVLKKAGYASMYADGRPVMS